MITVACVWTGNKYGVEYVERLRNMVARHLPLEHRFVCITDRMLSVPEDVLPLPALPALWTWWAKMQLFNQRLLGTDRILYLDLDTVIVGDLTPLATAQVEFGICENFTRLAGHPDWPCRYGSCVMVIDEGYDTGIYMPFAKAIHGYMDCCPKGDQQAIELLYPGARFLQSCLPTGYFLGYRDLTPEKPEGCAVVIFAGNSKPHNCSHQWIKDAWE